MKTYIKGEIIPCLNEIDAEARASVLKLAGVETVTEYDDGEVFLIVK